MCENQHELGGDSGRVTNRIVSQIQGYIAEHYAEKLTLTSIANQFYISPYYLSRLFKKTINLSLIEYINGVRIKAAQNMIEKTNESISGVAEKTGFMTSAHFRRNTAESRKFFYSGCILNIRNGQKREKPVAGVFKIKAARYPFCSGTGQPVWWFGRKKIKSFGKNLKLSPLHCQRQCRQ